MSTMREMSALELMGFIPLDIVQDVRNGEMYMVTKEWKLRSMSPPVGLDINWDPSMSLKKLTSTYKIPNEKLRQMDKPDDMFDEDWEEYKENNTYKITLKHNPLFDDFKGGIVYDSTKVLNFSHFNDDAKKEENIL